MRAGAVRACTVNINGQAVRSCVTAVGTVDGAEITTLEGLGSPENPHPLQKAFIDEQAMQCGFCINGVIMTAKALVDRTPNPTDAQIRQAMATVLCRCGAHQRMFQAIRRYAQIEHAKEDGMIALTPSQADRRARLPEAIGGADRHLQCRRRGVRARLRDWRGIAQGINGNPGTELDSWIAIAADGRVTAYTGKCEFGQGLFTAQTQLIAEELSVPLDRVTLIQCDTALTPDQGTTSGAQSHPANFNTANLALAGATAREALVQLASTRLGVPVRSVVRRRTASSASRPIRRSA